jgi:Carboxypeptidase regulatory-like domain
LYNWSAVRSPAHTGDTFIRNNLEVLTANNNMPEDFQTKYAADGDKCIELSGEFGRINMDKEMATQLKIEANNAIYAGAIEMLKNGQQIFRYDTAIKKRFTFNYLVSVHRGEDSASLRGYINDELNLPVEGVIIIFQNQKYTTTADSKGYYRISRIAQGTYAFHIKRPGYQFIDQAIIFSAGTPGRGDFIMKKQMQMVA